LTVPRALPLVDAGNEHFWRSGAGGQLRVLRCGSCGFWIHPPAPVCRRCSSRCVAPEPVSGLGVVRTFTINQHAWRPDMNVPFAIASIELVEQPGLYLTSNVVGCDPGEVHAGMAVEVSFLAAEDVWLPLFAPATHGERT
jgi:uncharacterized OB-fold protein